MDQFVSLIFLAGGKGSRFNNPIPKQFTPLLGTPICIYSLKTFLQISFFSEIIIVCEEKYRNIFSDIPKKIIFASPGIRRQDSVYNGLKKISPKNKLVCIHDAARPFVTKEKIIQLIYSGIKYKSATLGTKVINTIKSCSEKGYTLKTLDRSILWEIQTPQILNTSILEKGFIFANKNNITVSDDISLAELLGIKSFILEGERKNFKITTQEDFALAEFILEKERYATSSKF
jgi:2-C-methyl-D-erythritol 4-phosphate cytidylyltransferase